MACNESNYIKKLKKKKEDALEYIVDKYLGLVKGVSYKILSPLQNDGIIEECMNDVFLSVWNNSDKFSGDNDDFKKWICAITKFKALDYYRKEVKKSEVALDDSDYTHKTTVEDEIIEAENKEELIALINTLNDIDRDIFVMKFFLGIKSEDIALKLNLTKASVDNRISRGRKKLKGDYTLMGGSKYEK